MDLFKVIDKNGNVVDNNHVNQVLCKAFGAKHIHNHFVKSWNVNVARVIAFNEFSWSELKDYWTATSTTYYETVVEPVVNVFRENGWKVTKQEKDDRYRNLELPDSEEG